MTSISRLISVIGLFLFIGATVLTVFTFVSFVFMFIAAFIGTMVLLTMLTYVLDSMGAVDIKKDDKKIRIGQKTNVSQDDRIEMIKQKFVDGEISEQELEEMLDSEFGTKSKSKSKQYERII